MRGGGVILTGGQEAWQPGHTRNYHKLVLHKGPGNTQKNSPWNQRSVCSPSYFLSSAILGVPRAAGDHFDHFEITLIQRKNFSGRLPSPCEHAGVKLHREDRACIEWVPALVLISGEMAECAGYDPSNAWDNLTILLLLKAQHVVSGWGCSLACWGPGPIGPFRSQFSPLNWQKYISFPYFSLLHYFFCQLNESSRLSGIMWRATRSKPFWHCLPLHKLCDFTMEWVGFLDALGMVALTLATSHLMQKSRFHLSCHKLYWI